MRKDIKLLVKAIEELSAKCTALEARVAQLETPQSDVTPKAQQEIFDDLYVELMTGEETDARKKQNQNK